MNYNKQVTLTISATKCNACREELAKPKWLELSLTDGYYYATLPKSHESQGAFPFGTSCASRELNKTIEYLKGKM